MSATKKLRELLDERGITWRSISNAGATEYMHEGIIYTAYEVYGNLQVAIVTPITPEQAITATVGRDMCYDTEDYVCPQCGTVMDYETRGDDDEKVIPMDDYVIPLHYCPSCGRRVVE